MKKPMILMVFAVFLACTSFGTGKQEPGGQKAVSTAPKVLRLTGAAGGVASFDPTVTTASGSPWEIYTNAFRPLTYIDADGRVVPGIAESWSGNADNSQFTFKIRKNAVWSDGTPITAYDVEFTYKRQLSPDTGSKVAWYFESLIKGAADFLAGKNKDPNSVGVKVVDDKTVLIDLVGPCSFFPSITAVTSTSIIPKHVVEKYGKDWGTLGKAVYSGPFIPVKVDPGSAFEFVANDKYYGGRPLIDELKVLIFTQPGTAFAAYLAGELDGVGLTTQDLPRVDADPKLKAQLVSRQTVSVTNWPINLAKPAMKDVRVRRAINMAIDRQALVDAAAKGTARPLNQLLPPGVIGYDETVGYKFDVAAARKLLAEAGYPDGKGFPKIQVMYPGTDDIPLMLQQQLKQNLGIEVELDKMEFAAWAAKRRTGPDEIFMGGWSPDFLDPHDYLNNMWGGFWGPQFAHWENPEFLGLLKEGTRQGDPAKRQEIYKKASQIMVDDAPFIPMMYSLGLFLIRPEVKGLVPSIAGGGLAWRDLSKVDIQR